VSWLHAWGRVFEFFEELKTLGIDFFKLPDNMKKQCGITVLCCLVVVVIDTAGKEGAGIICLIIGPVVVFGTEFIKFKEEVVELGTEVLPLL